MIARKCSWVAASALVLGMFLVHPNGAAAPLGADSATLREAGGTRVLEVEASQARRGENCPNGLICWWDNNGFGGTQCSVVASDLAGQGWFTIGEPACNNMMNSWKNNSNSDAKWATGTGGGGTVHCMQENGQNQSVADPNTMSSIRVWNPSQNPCP